STISILPLNHDWYSSATDRRCQKASVQAKQALAIGQRAAKPHLIEAFEVRQEVKDHRPAWWYRFDFEQRCAGGTDVLPDFHPIWIWLLRPRVDRLKTRRSIAHTNEG